MTFEELLDQAIALLQRRGRVTYRTLKRQFQLDDDVLEDLKEELTYGQRLAVDEDGRVLVWTGGASTPPASIASTSVHQEGPQAPPHTRAGASPAEPSTPDAERRQLTVLFCDLVDSTGLASRLDPEELREVVRAYQDTCAKVIARFEGHIAQYLGDGLLVYFGYPRAHEDDAQRAVLAGLGMVEALQQMGTRVGARHAVPLQVRLGIHTGLVVVGEVGEWPWQEQLALTERSPEPGAGQGPGEVGMAQIQQGLAAWRATGAKVFRPYGLALLAEASVTMGQLEEGLTRLAEALALVDDTGERRWCWSFAGR